ncbi:hypothetical protein [Methylobacterium komagatae]
MGQPVECRIVDMPDSCFAFIAVLASSKLFRRVGLATLAEVEESLGMLSDLTAACRTRVTVARGAGFGALADRSRQVAAVRSMH